MAYFVRLNRLRWLMVYSLFAYGLVATAQAGEDGVDKNGGNPFCIPNISSNDEASPSPPRQPVCRFNADCCSGLCTTYNALNLKCVENVPNNHISDPYATSPTHPNFRPTKFDGMKRWQGKVAVITGAASGMGFALARRLCNEGMIVVGIDIHKDGVEKVADHCPSPNSYYSYAADLTREDELVSAFGYIDATLGRVDVLANNAGVARFFPLMSASSEGLRTMFDLNVLAPVLCTREALKIMLSRNITDGYIFFTNSIAGGRVQQDVMQPPGTALPLHAYEATKHALMVIREGLRQELRSKGLKIRVGEVAPGAVVTNIAESFVPRDETEESKIEHIFNTVGAALSAVKDRISPDDIAEAFVYMLQSPARLDINTILIQNN